MAIADGIAATAPIPSRYTTVALRDGGHRDFESAVQWEALAQPITLATADLQEGVRAAREKRTPDFRAASARPEAGTTSMTEERPPTAPRGCLPLANTVPARRGPLLGATLGRCARRVNPRRTGFLHCLWITLWIMCGHRGMCCGSRRFGRPGRVKDGSWRATTLRRGTGPRLAPDRLPPRAQPCRDLQGQGLPLGRRERSCRCPDEVAQRARGGTLRELPGIGASTAEVIEAAAAGPDARAAGPARARRGRSAHRGRQELRAALRGDLHSHSDWSDGGSPIEEMAFTAIELGHEYLVLTDHSPRLKVANGLSVTRLTPARGGRRGQ